jgi:hypothetical protein
MNQNKSKSRKQPRRAKNALSVLKPSFPGQPTLQVWVPVNPTVSTTTVTTGLIALSLAIDPTAIVSSWTTRFATWDEYRVIGWRAKVRCFASSNPGVLVHWIEEKNAAAPTNAIAIAAKGIRFSASDVLGSHLQTYAVTDPFDLEYASLPTSKVVGYYNLFTDNANWGASVVATAYCVTDIELHVQFRGFA